MDVLETLEFLDQVQFYDNLEIVGRPRIIRSRPDYFDRFDDLDFQKRYRMSKGCVLYVLELINDDLEFLNDKNQSISPINQLLICLRYFATGAYLLTLADIHGVSISSVSRIIKKVSEALVKLRCQFIKMPQSQEEVRKCQEKFFDIAGFPNVMGTIDCTHIRIQSPGGQDAELFRNRKHFFSVNVQTISDPDLKINNVVARWPGSTHDSAIFTNSNVATQLQLGVYGRAYLLGDSGYADKNFLLTPYLNPQNPAQERYNYSHIRTRNTVERQYGVLKRRFPALALGIRLNLRTAIQNIIACCILHNICMDMSEELPPSEINELYLNYHIAQTQFDQSVFRNQNNSSVKMMVTETFFS